MLYINIIYNIVKKTKQLDKTVKQIIVLLIIVLLLFVGTVILKNMTDDKNFEWDYHEIESVSYILNEGAKVNDRELYWNLKHIIYDFLYTMQEEEFENVNNKEIRASYLDYYAVLSKDYKKYLDKSQYEVKASDFINKFLQEDHLGYKYVSSFVLQDIYKYDNNKYLCVVVEEYMKNIGYIGLQIDKEESKFSIFYIE